MNIHTEAGDPESGPVTRLLADCAAGDREAFDRLVPLVYDDLRRIAHGRLAAERSGHTLNTTAVVHEAYVQLVNQATATWRDRAHFFAVAARVIRHVLIDYARARGAEKRGGGALHIPLREERDGRAPDTVELLALEEALTALARRDARLERMVECRFFGGMTMRDTAEALGVSLRTAERDWTRAKAYLYQALK
jgi:RNA polymerase sigma factor (TIGR02999 family)